MNNVSVNTTTAPRKKRLKLQKPQKPQKLNVSP